VLDAFEDEGRRLPRADLDARADVATVDDPERAARRPAELQLGRGEDRPVLGERDLVAGARIINARRDIDDQAHPTAHRDDPADQPLAVRRLTGVRGRHEVLDLSHAVGGQQPRAEDVRVGQAELPGAPALALGRDPKQAPAVGVEDRRKHARRVEPRAAAPVDRPIGTDKRDRVQVADQAVLGDRQVQRFVHQRAPARGLRAPDPRRAHRRPHPVHARRRDRAAVGSLRAAPRRSAFRAPVPPRLVGAQRPPSG
jgi:hypothetical protein